jgi:GT2 family glycosyltransferase
MPIDVVIVNWNSGGQLLECINSLIEHGPPLISQIIVVDNGSTDGSSDTIKNIVGVRIVEAGANLGFAKACNLGASLVKSEFLLFLNPDTYLFPDTLQKVLYFMQQHQNATVGICGVRLVDDYGNTSTSAARFPTLKILIGELLRLNILFPSAFLTNFMQSNELNESKSVDQVIGAFFLIRRFVFDLCKGFDEQFFVYFEEVDLSLRANRLGYTSYFLSDAKAFHKGGGCSDRVKATRLFYLLRSRILYAQTHYSYWEFVLLVLLTGLELPLRIVNSVMKVSWSDIKNTFAAYLQLLVYFVRRD